MKPVICADDFGYSRGVSEGILELCRNGKINATSVMVEAPLLAQYADKLKAIEGIQIGLHFNLTTDLGIKPYPRDYLLLNPFLRAHERSDIAARIRAQLLGFSNVFGRLPDFIDGHEHVHVMPSVRAIFLREVAAYYNDKPKKPWIRQVASPIKATDAKVKALVLNILNLGFARQCAGLGFGCNKRFLGIRAYAPNTDFLGLYKGWLITADEGTLIMVHPAKFNEDIIPIYNSRLEEYNTISTF